VGLVVAASWRGLQARAAARRPKVAESDTAAGPGAQ